MVETREIKIQATPQTIQSMFAHEILTEEQAKESLKQFKKESLVETLLTDSGGDYIEYDEEPEEPEEKPIEGEVVNHEDPEEDDFDDLD